MGQYRRSKVHVRLVRNTVEQPVVPPVEPPVVPPVVPPIGAYLTRAEFDVWRKEVARVLAL